MNGQVRNMGVEGQGEDRARRLARERALYQYTSALERGDFDAVAAVLQEAETDEALERLILEVNDACRVELAGELVPTHEDRRLKQLAGRLAVWRHRRGGKMGDAKDPSKRQPLLRGRRLSPGLMTGAVFAVVLACLGGLIIFESWSAFGSGRSAQDLLTGQPSLVWSPRLITEGREPEQPAPQEAEVDSRQAAAEPMAAAEVPQERLIVRTGGIALHVEDTLVAQQAIEDLVARLAGEGAYVVSSEQRGGDGGQDPYVSMAIRVPAARFGQAMDAIADLAVGVVSRSESAQDVTEEYVDLAGRLEALAVARDRLLEIMSQASRTVDLLQAEEQLTRREEEIEATQGRMQYLAQSAALAQITVQLQPYVLSQPVGDQRWRPAETARGALETLLGGAQGFVDFVLFFSIAVLPWLLALVLGAYLLYRFVRWAARRRQARPGMPDTTADA